jgi:hypothetical protein
VGTANFIDPAAGIKIVEGIRQFCDEQKIADVGSLVGSLVSPSNVSVIDSWL